VVVLHKTVNTLCILHLVSAALYGSIFDFKNSAVHLVHMLRPIQRLDSKN